MRTPHAARVSVAVLTLLAFALRVYHLDGQSLWYDEGFSVYLAQMSLREITARTAADIQPPAYYYLLHAWMTLFGRSEVAVRLLSVVFGVLTVPLAYLLARRMLSPAVGVTTALLVAVSPFHIWYAQETRMYTLVTALGVASSWLLAKLVDAAGRTARPTDASPAGLHARQVGALAAAWAAVNIVAVYTHYYAFLLVAFQALYLAMAWAQRGRPRPLAVAGVAALSVTALAYAPWAGFALNRYAVDDSYWQGALSLDFVRKTLLAFAAGHTVFEAQAQAITVGYLLLLALGVVWSWRHASGLTMNSREAVTSRAKGAGRDDDASRYRPAVFLLLYLVVPFVLLYLFSAWRPKFNPRYLMLASPAFVVLVAAGIVALMASRPRLWRPAGVLALVYVLGTSGYALANNYRNHVYVRDDFRSIAARIAAARQPDEAVILCSGHLFPVYDYYAPGNTAYRIPESATLSTRSVVTYAVADRLNQIATQHGGVWLVLWQNEVVDPAGILTGLLDAQAERLHEPNIYWGIELRHYRLPPGVRFAAPPTTGEPAANFANRLTLLGASPASLQVAAGDDVKVTLYWRAQQALEDDYWLSLRLVDPTGHVVSALNDRPAGYGFPTTRWPPQTTIPGVFRLTTPPATAPGDYTLQALVFSPTRGHSLDVLDARGAPAGVSAVAAAVRVLPPAQPPTLESLGLPRLLRLPMSAAIELAATDLSDQTVRQGDTVTFAVVWRSTARSNRDETVRLRLTAGGVTLADAVVPLATTGYPTSQWPTGGLVRSLYDLTIPANAPAQVNVEVSVDGGEAHIIARLNVSQVARSTAIPAMQHAQTAQFGALATLLGYDIDATTVRPGQTINLTLYWRAGAQAGQGPAYTVFTHLLDAGQIIHAQHDRPPADGARPTTGWSPGEVIVDRHPLTVSQQAPAGDYVLEIGLYDPLSERRLVVVAGDGQGNDHVILSTGIRVQR